MKKISFFILFLLAVTNFFSCKKSFLEIQPQQNIDQDNAIVNIGSTRSAVMGLYSFMQNANYYGRTLLLIPDLMTDNIVQSRQAGTRYSNYERRVVNSSDAYAEAFWENAYKLIINANAIINKAPLIQVLQKDSIEMRQLIGEAYALRAFAYLDLARFFCQPWNTTTDSSHMGVPIVLNQYPNDVNNVSYPERSTIAQTYNRVITDLNTALTFLPSNNEVYFNNSINTDLFKVRINRLSTFAILARAELYKENWAAAEAAATVVINSNRYALLNGLSIVNDYRTPQNIESIFELANNSFDNTGTEGIAYIFNQNGYGEMLGTQNLYTNYNSTDVRRGFMTLGNRNAAGAETNVPLINKYNNITNYQEHIKLFRLSEMYLIRCEARAKQTGGNFSGSQADLQVIVTARNSSSLTVVSTNTTPASVITRMLSERRRELAFEGHRLFDLTRNRLGFTKFRSDGTTVSVSATSFRNILPIPISEMRANPNLKQNPSY